MSRFFFSLPGFQYNSLADNINVTMPDYNGVMPRCLISISYIPITIMQENFKIKNRALVAN